MAYYTDWGEIQKSQIPYIPARYPAFLEKEFMNPFRYNLNHRMIPGFGVLAVICGVACVLLVNNDNAANYPYAIGVAAFLIAVFLGMMVYIKYTARKELQVEIDKYSFKIKDVERKDSYVLPYDNGDVELTREGYIQNGEFCSYKACEPRLATSHMFNRVWIALQLGENKKTAIFLHLTPVVLRAIRELEIPLENIGHLDYLVREPKHAMAQIYESGKFYILD